MIEEYKVPTSEDIIVMELKLPVGVQELAAVAKALGKIHSGLLMRQVGPMLQLFKLRYEPAEKPERKRKDKKE